MKNLGYAAALNLGVNYSSGDYILIMNPDVILEKDYLEKALKKMRQDRHIAALGGKTYRYDYNQSGKTAIFDTVGIFAMVDREILSARGAQDVGQFENSQEIFSIRNVCGFYMEDVDVCWRLHLFGWKVMFLPSLVAHHCIDKKKIANISEYKKTEKRYFMINERLMTLKNEFILNMIRDLFVILKKRFIKKSFLFSGWIEGWFRYNKLIPSAFRKRKYIMKRKRINRAEMNRWFIRQRSSKYNLYQSKSLEIYAKYPPIY
jgi:GT2 family glycosyltransferase